MNSKPVAELPPELVEQIQLNLPPKSLVRFRSVCKAWDSSFQDPSFVSAYNLRQTALDGRDRANTKILRLRWGKGTILGTKRVRNSGNDVEITAEDDVRMCFGMDNNDSYATRVVGSCNGIICLRQRRVIVFWNPSLRELKVVPLTCGYPYHERRIGFGYDTTADDYKVVHLMVSLYRGSRAEIYSLRRNSWKYIPYEDHGICYNCEFNTHINGIYHWKGTDHIISFDVSDEEFRTSKLPLPLVDGFDRHIRYLTSWNERLAMVVYAPDTVQKTFDIWIQREIGVEESWTKQLRFGPRGIQRPVAFWDSEMIFLETKSGELILYNSKTKKFKDLGMYSCVYFLCLITYVPSLVSVNGRPDHENGLFHKTRPRETCLDYPQAGLNLAWRKKLNID